MQEILANKKFLIIAGVIIALVLSALAFIIFQEEPVAPAPTSNIQTELVWWNVHSDPVYAQIAQEFESQYSNVRIEIVDVEYNQGETYYQDLVTEFARGTAPDIFSLRNDDIPAWREFITPIKDLPGISNSKLIEDYRENFVSLALKETTYRDQIYGVTNYVDNIQMYYNEDILDQAGIPLRPATWTELEEQLRTLNKREAGSFEFEQSGIALGVGLQNKDGDLNRDSNLPIFYDIAPTLIFQNGNSIYDEVEEKITFGDDKNNEDLTNRRITEENFDQISDEDPSYAALRYFLSFAEVNSNRYSWSLDSNNAEEAFLEGRLAYLLHYRSFADTIQERNSRLNYGLTEIPQLDLDQKKTYGKFFAEVMNRNLEQDVLDNPRDAEAAQKYQFAKLFMYYLSLPEVQEKILGKTGLPASRYDLIAKQQDADSELGVFASGNLYADNYYKPHVTDTERIWGKLLYRYHYENVPLKKSLGEAIEEYNLLVQQGAKIRF
jgi:ABC-type glycerol-3-phosphate transport system substrate-binding protein